MIVASPDPKAKVDFVLLVPLSALQVCQCNRKGKEMVLQVQRKKVERRYTEWCNKGPERD